MTNETLFEDLKQILTASLAQFEERINGRFDRLEARVDGHDAKLELFESRFDRIEAKLDAHRAETRAGFEGVGDAISAFADEHDRLAQRVTKLEAARFQG